MFTGIVEEAGIFLRNEGDAMVIGASRVVEGTEIGESISVNGCCLTVVAKGDDWLRFDVMDETRRCTTMGSLTSRARVNLERAARLSDRINGHLVQGHVDAVGIVVNAAPALRISMPLDLVRYLVPKGSITIDGVSLTVVNVYEEGFDVALIPHTLELTNLGGLQPGDAVNLEIDVMAKYVERLLSFQSISQAR